MLERSRLRRLAVVFFLVYAAATTWPVATLVADGGPLVFGLPRPLAWAILWILLGFGALLLLEFAERREEGD